MNKKFKIGVVGGSGYVAGELLRLLIHHPNIELDFIQSHSHAGEKVQKIHQDLFEVETVFSNQINPNVDVIFICSGHGKAKSFLEQNAFSNSTKIIDLSADFRLQKDANYNDSEFVYGLPELNKDKIQNGKYIANPGCFATAIQLALLPLAKAKSIKNDIHINAITGATGAGQSHQTTTHFSWRNENISVYKVFEHQHLTEIKQSLNSLQNDFEKELHFIPMRGNFTRGIFATVYTQTELSEKELKKLYQDFYKDSPFVKISDADIHLKQVVNTNYCLLQVQKKGDMVLVTSAIDNLLKGAAGQAVQNMNLQLGLPQTTGLQLKASYF
ncbi:N-acetyl-gamma-glutamyl-phosphate reductase [Bernardetia sp.]|uniref:N-acetyl-gamma-glutamyl-phosphate reductase n=1 Tax=Bernardetia sp. TaxID=1937974 RepID=UPI0025BBCDF3|nr:N-acetyl-gamma-glutamyl-phosphate reductase [Bernardetia sp.]